MKPLASSLFTGLFLLFPIASPLTAATLLNGGFEDPVTSDGAPFVGFWEAFSSGGAATSANSTVSPRTGAQSLALEIVNVNNAFAGAFQDVPGLVGGMETIFSGFHRTSSSPLDLGVEVRIEWRNSVSNTEVGRTPNQSPIPGVSYGPFSLTATVPVGADTARVVYAIQTFGPEPTNTGTVFVDDVVFVPEPTSGLLFGLGTLALAGRRRRKGSNSAI